MSSETATFHKERHVKYWLRCLKTVLPNGYQSADSSRLSLGFFTLAALDLLDVLDTHLTPIERQGYIDSIYHCQLPTGGFRSSPVHDLGDRGCQENACWDPPTIPMTFFALQSLLILGDDLSRVRRSDTLQWLPKLQRPDGGFGELLGPGEHIEGSNDLRFCCCAAGIRHVLRGQYPVQGLPDINTELLASYIASCEVSVLSDLLYAP